MSDTKSIPPPDDWQALKPHPLSELTVYGAGVDVETVADRMANAGYDKRESIVLYEGKILDGRLRHASAIKASVVPSFCEFIGKDALTLIERKTLRQHLSPSQLGLFVAGLAKARAGQVQTCTTESETAMRDRLAKETNAGVRTADYASIVLEHGTGSLQRAVRNGVLKISDAAKIARKPQAVQDYAVAEVQAHRAKTAVEAATLCDRCQKKLTKKGEQPTVDCVVCRDLRENPKPKGAGKGSRKPAKAKAQPEPAPEFKPAAVLAAAATSLYEFIDKTPGTLGWHDHPEQKKLKAEVDELVAALEAWQGRLAGEEAKLFDNKRGQYGR